MVGWLGGCSRSAGRLGVARRGDDDLVEVLGTLDRRGILDRKALVGRVVVAGTAVDDPLADGELDLVERDTLGPQLARIDENMILMILETPSRDIGDTGH